MHRDKLSFAAIAAALVVFFGIGGGGGGGELVLVERQSVSAVSTVTFSGLTGNSDGLYMLVWRVTASAADIDLYYRPNGNAASDNNEGVRREAGVGTTNSGNDMLLVSGGATQEVLAGVAYLWPGTARERLMWAGSVSGDEASANANAGWNGGEWDETSTEVTSIDVVTSTGTITGVFSLYRLPNGD